MRWRPCATQSAAIAWPSASIFGRARQSPAIACHRRRPKSLAVRAVDAGAGAVIVLDLARVGTAAGPDFELLARVHAAVPATPVFAGGGVRGFDDLARLAAAGCAGALVASALHDGALSATR